MATNRSGSFNRRHLLLSASGFLLTGCGGLDFGPKDSNDTIYVLDPATEAQAGGRPLPWALAVDIPDASDAIDSRRIALIKSDATMDYYANAMWPDRLPMLVQTALVAGFEASGRVPSVSRAQDAVHADYELGTDIRDCAAHYGTQDGIPSVTVSIVAQISTARARKIVASFTAKATVAAGQNSTGAAVAAFNTALGRAVAEIVNWALSLPLPPAPPI
jgi:cholesterol transport system auxiliary component